MIEKIRPWREREGERERKERGSWRERRKGQTEKKQERVRVSE